MARPAAIATFGSPPWHVAQPSVTVPDGCMEASSVLVWQVMQPALAAFASSEVSMAAFTGVTPWGCGVMPDLKVGPTGDGPTGDGPTGDGPTGDGPTGPVDAATVHTNAAVQAAAARR